jgi:DNA repair protein RecN (Recombination protein N)
LDALAARLTDLVTAANDIGAELADYEVQLDADPGRLAAVHERRAELSTLTRKYGADLESVLSWAAEAEARLVAADTSDEALAELTAARDRAATDYARIAAEVSERRRKAATDLSDRITAELAGLAMSGSAVAVVVRPRAVGASGASIVVGGVPVGATSDGVDEVEITLRSHPDAPALPVQRGASGGELSRVMLAIEVVLAGTDPVPTMVFDEVDAGVGGRAATEVGRRLARLARRHQVIVVTHLAQVASFADHHLVVDKSTAADETGVTRSDIRRVDGDDRLIELARMLAGEDTPVAREHAAELLASASEPTTTEPPTAKRRSRKAGQDR